jgi:hypothetical protein
MGENKPFNLKDKTSLKRFAKHPTIHIHIRFCVGNSSSVTMWLQTGSGMAKFPIFSRNLQKFVPFSWAPPSNQNENVYKVIWLCKLYLLCIIFILVRGWHPRKLFIKRHIFLCISAKNGYNFAISLPVWSLIVTLGLFPTQNLIWISIAWYLMQKVWATFCLLN